MNLFLYLIRRFYFSWSRMAWCGPDETGIGMVDRPRTQLSIRIAILRRILRRSYFSTPNTGAAYHGRPRRRQLRRGPGAQPEAADLRWVSVALFVHIQVLLAWILRSCSLESYHAFLSLFGFSFSWCATEMLWRNAYWDECKRSMD